MARMVPSCRRITWAICASVPIGYSSSTWPISSCSLERWVTSATGCEVRTARSSALTLRSRPTCSGTIISGKMTVSRSATSGRTWRRSSPAPFSSSVASISGMSLFLSSVATWGRSLSRWFGVSAFEVFGESLYIVLIEQIVDPDLAEGFELKDDPHAGEVDSLTTREKTDDTNALDVRLAVETEVVATLRLEESLLLVDPQRPGMTGRQLGGDADDVAGSGELVATRKRAGWRPAPRSFHLRPACRCRSRLHHRCRR